MDDFTYDSVQKKKLAKNAIHKKNGSKSKKCSLPSDGMSRKEWEEMNGDVITVKMNQPMSWAEFTELSADLQEEYMTFLMDNFHVQPKYYADMFGIDKRTLLKWVTDHNLDIQFPVEYRPTNRQLDKWDMFIAGEDWMSLNDSPEVMAWEGFKMLSPDEQERYLQNLIDTYNPSQARLAEAMGVKGNTLSTLCKRNHLNIQWPQRTFFGITKESDTASCPCVGVSDHLKPMLWGSFKQLPFSSQEEYLQKLIDIYGATTIGLGEMFCVHPSTVTGYANRKGLNVKFRPKTTRPTAQEKARWNSFIAEEAHQEASDITEPEPNTTDATEKEEPEITTDISITLKGDINVEELVSLMRSLLGDSSRGTLNLKFQKEEAV